MFPLIESFHVAGLTIVFGSIAVLDCRLLGLASSKRPVSRVMDDIIRWTWAGFTLAVITGSLMFITNADVYYHNFLFRTKMLLLLLAGVNMLVFELTTGKTMYRWDKEAATTLACRIGATVSLVLWISLIFAKEPEREEDNSTRVYFTTGN